MFIGAMVALCIGCWFLQKKDFNVAFISIGWDYFQVLALFSRADIDWPPLMRAMFTFFSAFNFNIDITAPECLIPNLDYKLKWWFIMLIPLAAFSFLCLAFVFEIIRDRCSGVTKLHIGRKFGKVISTVPPHAILRLPNNTLNNVLTHLLSLFSQVIAQYLLMLYYVYLSVTRRALDIFNCNPSNPADGYYYTEFTSIDCEGGLCKCHIEGSVQVFLKVRNNLLTPL